MALFVWKDYSNPVVTFFIGSSVAGTLFGLAMAFDIERRKKKLNLTNWEDFGYVKEEGK